MALINRINKSRRVALSALLILALLLGVSAVALAVGPFRIPLADLLFPTTPVERAVVGLIRLPRIVMAVLVGGGLAASGAALQALFRNPIVEPGVLGVSSGAALAAVFTIAIGAATLFVPLAAVAGAGAVVVLLYTLMRLRPLDHLYTLLLFGLAITTFGGALISLLLLTTQDLLAQREILFWLTGGLNTTGWENVLWVMTPTLAGLAVLLYHARDLNLLMTGEEEATTLGLNVGRVRLSLVLTASVITGVAVAFTGIISFVGLIIPHMLRLLLGHDNRIVLPLSVAAGATFLLAADTLARVLVSPAELPVGVVTAIVGTPVFVYLLVSRKGIANVT